MKVLLFSIARFWLPLCLAMLLLITILSLTPLSHLPPAPGSDKLHHLLAYAALIFPLALRQPGYWLCYGLAFAGWSGAIELLQPYVNRYGQWFDLLANIIGLGCGLLLALLARRRWLR